MTRARSLAVGLLAATMVMACEKDRPKPEQPGPTVIVEQPGLAPAEMIEDEAIPPSEPEAAEFGTFEIARTDVPCTSDAECVKDSCCHASSCVAIADAPDCSAAVCTLECRSGTMDCYGGCLCQSGRCAARLWSAPD